VTLRARLYDARGDDRDVDIADVDLAKVDDRKLLWVDLDGRDPASLDALAGALGLEPRALRELRDESRHPSIVRLPERVVVTLVAIDRNGHGGLVQRDVDLVVGRNLVVTVHEGPLRSIARFDEEFRHERDIGELDAGAFMTGLVDAVLGAYLDEVEAIDREIEELDQVALRSTGDDDTFLDAVVALRRRIAIVRRVLTPNRNALQPLLRPDFEVHGDIGTAWPGIITRLEQAIAAVENARESLVGSLDIYLGRSAQRSNDVMKTLTIVSAIALPAIVLAGVMGMNFHLEFFDQPSNFWLVLVAMIAFATVILVVARWRRWI
jgi:magnesium/cobalt transport protein CorA